MAANPTVDELVKGTDFPIAETRIVLHGGGENYSNYKKWCVLFDREPLFDRTDDAFLSRPDLLKKNVQRSLRAIEIMKANRDFLAAHSPVHGDGGFAAHRVTATHSGVADHFALFVMTLMGQGTPEQLREWLPKALNLEIIGTYAQTELGHGSNVRGLETIATFDQATDEVIIDMPTLTAMKWWPGALGILATHAVVYARLIVNKKDLGFHAFMVQIRDERHKPLPGIEVGDIGPKMGGNGMDAGYLRIRNVRVPRFNMLAKFQQLGRDGSYKVVPIQLAKIAYATMMKTRVLLSLAAAYNLAKGLTIALRYNSFRRQGFVDGKKGIASGELVILDYPIQQYRLFMPLAACFGIAFAGFKLLDLLKDFDNAVKKAGKDLDKVDTNMLPELHATSAGLKAFGTEMACNGLEEARRCCGGQGYSMASGIAGIVLDYLPNVTYEGDRLPMALQTARALVGVLAGKVKAMGTFAYLVEDHDAKLTDPLNLDGLVAFWQGIARKAVMSAGEQLMEAAAAGLKQDAAWNACHLPLVNCANAHICSNIMSSYKDGIARLPEGARPAMTKLALFFGLTKLGEVSVAFTQLTPDTAKLVDQAVKLLCGEIRPYALPMIESWGVSDRHLASCIARSDGKIYESVASWAKRSPLNEPAYVDDIRQNLLGKFVNAEYLRAGNAHRASAKL